jgi:hypothetical protein
VYITAHAIAVRPQQVQATLKVATTCRLSIEVISNLKPELLPLSLRYSPGLGPIAYFGRTFNFNDCVNEHNVFSM